MLDSKNFSKKSEVDEEMKRTFAKPKSDGISPATKEWKPLQNSLPQHL